MNVISRRDFSKTIVATAAGSSVCGSMLALEGCNSSQWISTILADMHTIIQIITSILNIVGAAGVVVAPVIAQVKEYGADAQAALTEAQSLVAQYNTASAADRPGLLGKIHAVLLTAENNLNSILDVFHVSDATLEAAIAGGI